MQSNTEERFAIFSVLSNSFIVGSLCQSTTFFISGSPAYCIESLTLLQSLMLIMHAVMVEKNNLVRGKL